MLLLVLVMILVAMVVLGILGILEELCGKRESLSEPTISKARDTGGTGGDTGGGPGGGTGTADDNAGHTGDMGCTGNNDDIYGTGDAGGNDDRVGGVLFVSSLAAGRWQSS